MSGSAEIVDLKLSTKNATHKVGGVKNRVDAVTSATIDRIITSRNFGGHYYLTISFNGANPKSPT